jgi:hypothetical protein
VARIHEQPSTVVCPSIDSISDRTLDYGAGGGHAVGGFYWTLDFNWQASPPFSSNFLVLVLPPPRHAIDTSTPLSPAFSSLHS